jgi:hypothetical protein
MATVNELAKQFGVSNTSVRNALDDLGLREDHVRKVGKRFEIDAEGCSQLAYHFRDRVAFLSGKSDSETPQDSSHDSGQDPVQTYDLLAQIERLRTEVERKNAMLSDYAGKLSDAQTMNADLLRQLSEAQTEHRVLMDKYQRRGELLLAYRADVERTRAALDEAGLFERIFGFRQISRLLPAPSVVVDSEKGDEPEYEA